MPPVLTDDLIRFAQSYLGSIWALKIMSIMMQEPEQTWTVDALVLELRASSHLVSQVLARFQRLGLIDEKHEGWCWRPAPPEIEHLVRGIADAYAMTPVGVIQAIAESPQDSIRLFPDAAHLRKG